MNIRSITFNDAPQLMSLFEQIGYPQSVENIEERLESCLKSEIYHGLVYELNQIIIGMCFFTIYPSCLKKSHKCILEALVVDGDYRSKGYATSLIEEVEKIALGKGCDSISLTSNKARLPSIYNFYLTRGYSNDGVKAQWYLKKKL